MKNKLILCLLLIICGPLPTGYAQTDPKQLADELMANDRPQEALVEYRKAALSKPAPDLYFNMSIAYFQTGQIKNAVDCLEKVVFEKPGDFEALYDLGCLLIRERKLDEAAIYFEKARLCCPPESMYHRCSGQALRWIEDFRLMEPRQQETVFALLERLTFLLPGF